jgi:hypothetical protein
MIVTRVIEELHVGSPVPLVWPVSDDTTSSGFSRVREENLQPAGTIHEVEGFAVDGGRVLLAGSYQRKESLFLGRLEELDFAEVTPADEAGEPLQELRAFGRRSHLYLATKEALHVVDLRTL